jgi:dolichyl-phosphate beta-glucosyltransferase
LSVDTARQPGLPHSTRGTSSAGFTERNIAAILRRPRCHLEVVIPALNEARRLPATLAATIEYLEAQPYTSSVVVVDNGSVDQTSDLAARKWSDSVPVYLAGCAQRGKGAAVRRGLQNSSADFAGYMDADLATPIETLDQVVPLLESGQQAVVGSRRIGGAALARRQPVHRSVGGTAFRAVARRILPGVSDSQCGFKFFSGSLARALASDLRVDGFAFDLELLRAVTRMGIPIAEVPVVWSDGSGSSLRLMSDGTRAAIDVLRMARRRAAA